jgi:hypothetical protein
VAVYLVCEDAIDGRVLDAVVVQRSGLNVQIALAGGSAGLGAIRRYLETRTTPNDTALTVRDRDYDRTLTEANALWTKPAGREFVWRRHEIENYLLEPKVVLDLFSEWRALPSATWATALPATEADVDSLLQSLAVPQIPAHAAELLRTEITQATNAVGSVRFTRPNVQPAPGSPTPGQAEWLAALVAEAVRLCGACTALAALPELQSAAVTSRYNALLAQCQAPTFLTSREYLREMGGKELLAALAQHLYGLGAPGRLNSNAIADQLLTTLGRVYKPNALFQPDDFAELATVLAQY